LIAGNPIDMRVVIVIAVLSALGFGGWYGYQHWINAPKPATYETAEVKKTTIVSTVSATGTLEPLVKVVVGTQVSGTIMKWYADFNQPVKSGFVLAELDQDRFKAVVEQRKAAVAIAQASIEEAKARLAKAGMDRERIERMHSREAATDYEIRTAKAEEDVARGVLHAAEAQLESAQADLRQATVELDKTIIRSPIDGVVISRDVDEGQTVAATMQAPTLFTIANDLTKMRVNAAVSEMDIGKVRKDMKVEFRVDAYPDRKFQGVVSQVRYAEKIENNVVTYTTLISVENPELLLRPGMTARILFEVDRAADVLAVPNAALRFVPQANSRERRRELSEDGGDRTPRVFRLEGDGIKEVAVKLGLSDGKQTAVSSEKLRAGDQVVIGEENPSSRSSRGSRL
jgi:HlyD family secretion protein